MLKTDVPRVTPIFGEPAKTGKQMRAQNAKTGIAANH
jgi:hypothetical protein